jgi:hypothetical protein
VGVCPRWTSLPLWAGPASPVAARRLHRRGFGLQGPVLLEPYGGRQGQSVRPSADSAMRSGSRKDRASLPHRKPTTRSKGPPKAGGKEKAAVVLLSGGNPQIAKADGDAPVQAYIAAMPGWKRDLGKRLDAIIVRTVPNVRKAVKWNSPFYGVEGQGWFLGIHTFTHYVKVAFFRGSSLRPVPPGPSKDKNTRYLDIHEGDELDEAQMATWVKQAAALPGWVPGRPPSESSMGGS